MSDEEDYMSDKFLNSLADVKPSLIQNRAKKRELKVAAEQTEVIKRQREERRTRTGENAHEKLKESLKQPLDEKNKGFQLLAKMGYKSGEALGKPAASSSDRLIEPIGISIKTGRSGLGREAALRELNEKRAELKRQHLLKAAGAKKITTEEFRQRSKEKADERFIIKGLRCCQVTCENLDLKNGLKTPELDWFWPEKKVEKNEEDSNSSSEEECNEEESYTDAEKLEMLTSYLRTSYTYCFFCAVQYQDVNDLESNCPGLTRDDH